MVTCLNIKRGNSFKHTVNKCIRMPEEYSLLKLLFDVLWIIWLTILSFTCNKTDLVIKDHLQRYWKYWLYYPASTKNIIAWVLNDFSKFQCEFSKTGVKISQLEWVNNWSIGWTTKQREHRKSPAVSKEMLKTFLYLNKILGPKKTHLMTKKEKC